MMACLITWLWLHGAAVLLISAYCGEAFGPSFAFLACTCASNDSYTACTLSQTHLVYVWTIWPQNVTHHSPSSARLSSCSCCSPPCYISCSLLRDLQVPPPRYSTSACPTSHLATQDPSRQVSLCLSSPLKGLSSANNASVTLPFPRKSSFTDEVGAVIANKGPKPAHEHATNLLAWPMTPLGTSTAAADQCKHHAQVPDSPLAALLTRPRLDPRPALRRSLPPLAQLRRITSAT